MLSRFSHVWLFASPSAVAHQASLSMGFSRQQYWSGWPCLPPGDHPNPRIKPACTMSPALAGGFLVYFSTKWDAHYIRYIVLINKFSRKHIGLRQYTSIFLELLWVKNKERASLASYVSLCLGGNWVMAWATVTWTLSWAGGIASKLAHSLGFRGRPQHLTTWSSAQVAWETSSFIQGQWQQTGRRKPPHQVWVCHTVTSVMCNHEKWSLSPAHSVERT